jgi:hypothetical protein
LNLNEEIFYIKQHFIHELEALKVDNRALRVKLKAALFKKKINSNRTRSTADKIQNIDENNQK